VIATGPELGYSTRQVADALGIPDDRVRALAREGLLAPDRSEDGQYRFTFRDIVLLRTTKELQDTGVPPRRVRRALRQLHARLPEGMSLSQVSIEASGDRVVVRDGSGVWEVESGQVELEFPVPVEEEPGTEDLRIATPVSFSHTRTQTEGGVPAPGPRSGHVPGAPTVAAPASDADDADFWYNQGVDLEAVSSDEARSAYERALALEPGHADARANLGRILHERGDVAAAERHYRAALEAEPDNVTAAFNLGVALEDRGQPDAAVEAYLQALESDPAYGPAHFNLARLFEAQGRPEAALRHLAHYRRISQGSV
jgi:DNA-binding transcriptional MerR regulator